MDFFLLLHKDPARRGFFIGACAGLVAVLLVVAVGIYFLRTRGVVVRVSAAHMTDRVGRNLKSVVNRELRELASDLRHHVPERIAGAIADRLSAEVLLVGGIPIRIPGTVIQRVRVKVEESVRAGLDDMQVSGVFSPLTDRLVRRFDEYVTNELREMASDRPLMVELWPGILVRVTVQIMP